MTKSELSAAYRDLLPRVFPWAQDQDRLDRFMASFERTIRTSAATWNHNSPTIWQAWRTLGGKGRPTLKAMRALED